MKFTKTNNIRIYVSKDKREDGRGDFYQTPKQEEVNNLNTLINDRISKANRQYNLFFNVNNNDKLDQHFENIVLDMITKTQQPREILLNYNQYDPNDGNENDKKKLNNFYYNGSGTKNIKNAMTLYVRERLKNDTWQEPSHRDAVVEILMCICSGKKYDNGIKKLDDSIISSFNDACLDCESELNKNDSEFFIPSREISNLQNDFTALMKNMIEKNCGSDDILAFQEDREEDESKTIDKLVQWLIDCDEICMSRGKRGDLHLPLSRIHFPWATEDRLQAILVRMRRALKRGTNEKISVELMQGMAQMNGRELELVIEEMMKDAEKYKQLKKFIGAIVKNYYRTDVLKSIKQTDVKVQPDEILNKKDVLSLSNAGKEQKAPLNETLLRYASSQKSSEQTLLEIKDLLFSYFSIEDTKEYLNSGNVWKMPSSQAIFFDYDFKKPENDMGSRDASWPLEDLWEEKKPNIRKIKNRIMYVNYGIYKNLRDDANSEFEKYWLKYIKEYVEKNYTGKRKISREGCYSTSMLSACWKDIIGYLCGKYIDIGKAVYHFAMPRDLDQTGEFYCGRIRDEYKTGISSFDYETIKAEETLQRDISVVTMAAVSSFSNSVIDEEKRTRFMNEGIENLEDVLLIKDSKGSSSKDTNDPLLWDMIKPNAVKQLLRFYGGASTVKGIDFESKEIEKELISEIKAHLNSIRNENFHYTSGKKIEVSTKYTRILWENERKAYKEQIIKRYYSNNTGMFYPQDNLKNLIEKLYMAKKDEDGKEVIAEAQIPSFRKIWQRKELENEISGAVKKADNEHKSYPQFLKGDGKEERQLIFGNALYFLLKEIYYKDFILNPMAKEYFFKAAENYMESNCNDPKHGSAVKNFDFYINNLKKTSKDLTFGGICQAIMQEYSQQNARKEDTAIYQHYKMLFPIYVKEAFALYVKKKYGFLEQPIYRELSGEQHFLDDVSISCLEFPEGDTQSVIWYTFAHFIHPKQLNLLVGDFKSYIQFRQDILKRMDCANALPTVNVERRKIENEVCQRTDQAKAILDVLDFVRVTSGRVSNCFEDYYESEDAYAEYLNQYVDFEMPSGVKPFDALKIFCQNALPEGENFDLYADERNPKVLRNVEIARMYAGGDLPLAGRLSVSPEEIKSYYENKSKTDQILSQGLCENSDKQDEVLTQQQSRNRLTLNDVTDIYALVSDLLGELISLAYLRERDQMYLLLGFYYMTLQSAESWTDEELKTVKLSNGKINIKQGFVLYQVVSVYDYGMKLPYLDDKGKWDRMGGQLSRKYLKFHDMHKKSMDCALQLFGQEQQLDQAVDIRNYVDHGKYYTDHSKSLIDLYNDYYTIFFGYSRKLRTSVTHNFQTQLGRYFLEATFEYKKGTPGFSLADLDSIEFIYKLQGGKTCNKKARNAQFVKEVRDVLEFTE